MVIGGGDLGGAAYTWTRKAIIVDYITNLPIYDLSTVEERIPGSGIFMQWWDQDLNPDEEGDNAIKGSEREIG